MRGMLVLACLTLIVSSAFPALACGAPAPETPGSRKLADALSVVGLAAETQSVPKRAKLAQLASATYLDASKLLLAEVRRNPRESTGYARLALAYLGLRKVTLASEAVEIGLSLCPDDMTLLLLKRRCQMASQ